jgi:hypothetical protein
MSVCKLATPKNPASYVAAWLTCAVTLFLLTKLLSLAVINGSHPIRFLLQRS